MSEYPEVNGIIDTHLTVVVLRLVVDHNGQLSYGEVVDIKGKLLSRFATWPGLVQSIDDYLINHREDNNSERPINILSR
jgi:hypothetical protein